MTSEEWNSPQASYNPSFDTPLSPTDESLYRAWKQQYAPGDPGDTYDYRGAYAAGAVPALPSGHWTDEFKKPNYPTFSVESQYAGAYPERAGHWEGDTFVPPLPQARPSELPSPPLATPGGASLPAALADYGYNMFPHSMAEVGQRINSLGEAFIGGFDPRTWRNMPLIPPRLQEIYDASGQEQMNKAVALGLDALTAGRQLTGGRAFAKVPYPIARYLPQARIADASALPPALPGQRWIGPPPPTGERYLESFRNALANKDDYGAINTFINSHRNQTPITLTSDLASQLTPRMSVGVSEFFMRDIQRQLDEMFRKMGTPTPYDPIHPGGPAPPVATPYYPGVAKPPPVYEDLNAL